MILSRRPPYLMIRMNFRTICWSEYSPVIKGTGSKGVVCDADETARRSQWDRNRCPGITWALMGLDSKENFVCGNYMFRRSIGFFVLIWCHILVKYLAVNVDHIDGFVQDCCDSIVNTLGLLEFALNRRYDSFRICRLWCLVICRRWANNSPNGS